MVNTAATATPTAEGTPASPPAIATGTARDGEGRSDEAAQDGTMGKLSGAGTLVPEVTPAATDSSVHVIPENKMLPVMFALALVTFLAALDQTIVSVALSTIARDLNASSAALSWIGAAYLLCVTALCPLYGKLSNYVGRKPVMYSSIGMFLLGSALCGAAQNAIWLCAARGVQGLGGGGCMQMTQIIVGDITPLATRGKWGGMIGATWGLAAVLGPLIGGALTDSGKNGWRYCFFINLPTGAFALALLIFFLKLNPHKPPKFSHFLATFDFLGLALLMSGLIILLVGFTSGEADWSAPQTIACLIIGIVVLAVAVRVELTTKRSAVIPPRLFHMRTSGAILFGAFNHGFAFISLSYFFPLYFQVFGSSPLMSGVLLMPFSVGTAIVGVLSGLLVAKLKRCREVIITSFFFSVLGYALLATLNESSSLAQKEIYLLVAAVGVGPLFQLLYLSLQSAMPIEDMAASTGCLGLVRSIGGTVGVSVCGAIYGSRLRAGLSGVVGYEVPAGGANAAVNELNNIMPFELRRQVQRAYSRALNFPWIIAAPLLFLSFLATFAIKHYTLDRSTAKAADVKKDAEDLAEVREKEKEEADSPV